MALSRERFLLDRRRIRQVLDYLEHHLDDENMALGSLADVANLSRYHFERIYLARVGEPPGTTIRRLRLARAYRALLDGSAHSITDLAVQAGYGSLAAFSRAFARAYAMAPSALAQQPPAPTGAPTEIVRLPAVPIWRLPYSGPAREVFAAGEEFSWLLARGGARHWRHWTVHPETWVDPAQEPARWVRMWHCVPQGGLPPRLPGVEDAFLPGGTYLRVRLSGTQAPDFSALAARLPAETGWQLVAGPVVRHFPQISHHRPPSERCVLFHLPVAPLQNSKCDQTHPRALP